MSAHSQHDVVETGSFEGLELNADEQVRAVFRPDLDDAMRYASQLVVLTDKRVYVQSQGGSWHSEPIGSNSALTHREHGGIGELRLLEAGRGVLRFRHTLAEAEGLAAFTQAFEALELAGAAERRARPQAPLDDGIDLPAPSGRMPLLRLLAFAKPHLPKVVLGFFLTLSTTAVGLIPPYLTMPLVDRVLIPGQAGKLAVEPALYQVAIYLGGLGLAAFVAWLLAWAQGAVLANVTERISADLRNRTFEHLQRLSLEYFGGKRTGDLIARISTDSEHLCSFLSDTLIDFITDVLMIAGTATVLISLDPVLALSALISFPPIAWLIVRIRGRLTHGFLRGGRVWSAMTNILADTIPGIRVVKAFSQERREVERFARANERIVDVNNRINALWTFFWPLVALLNQLGLLVVWAVGAYQVLHDRVTVGVLTAFIAYISRFYTRVESMSRMLTATQRASAGAQRLFEILDRVPSVLDPRDPLPLREVKGEVRFERVSFRYGSRLVLDDVSFTVKPGQLVGIVGHTGSGKSTIANLLCRFYDASSGAVLLDGVDLRRFSIEEYRKHISIVLQDPFLFFGTIAENVAYGRPHAGGARIIDAARGARAHEFVLKLPEAYDSLVGERGQSLSGGERQRIAIARAILVDPRILILDEATSAVDVQTERDIQRALDNVVSGRTTFAIAHRLSTLEKADLLVVIKDGKLAEMGTKAELLALNGEYAKLHKAQAKAAKNREEAEADEQPEEPSLPVTTEPLYDVARLRLEWDSEAHLWVIPEGGERRRVTPRRCFPLTDPEHFVSLIDEQGRERACFHELSELDGASRDALTRALEASEFLPRIERILKVKIAATRSAWQVDTDRGRRDFVIEQEDHIRRLEDGRHLITDSHGMRYLVPAPERLDPVSRKWLARFA
jgi:ATP-binding cassette subfamily B protein